MKVYQKKVLVVCTGNLFRSPIAAAFLSQAFQQRGLQEQILVNSAGLEATPGQRMPVALVSYLYTTYKLELAGHTAHPILPALFREADVVLTMEQQQIMRLAQQYPRETRKLRQLSELTGRIFEINDPAANPDADLKQLAGQLHNLINNGLPTLLHWLKI